MEEPSDFRLAEILQGRLGRMQHRPKRARTRAALIAATALEMERSGVDALTVARIADAAGTAHGTFYLYFQNRLHAVMAVRRFYYAAVRRLRPRGGGGLSPFEAIKRMNRFYVRSYANNADLLRATQLLLYTHPGYAIHRDWVNDRWSRVVVRDLERRSGAPADVGRPAVAPEGTTLLARSAMAMVDEVLREIYVHDSPSLAPIRADEDQLVEVLSLAWFRVMYGRNPERRAREGEL